MTSAWTGVVAGLGLMATPWARAHGPAPVILGALQVDPTAGHACGDDLPRPLPTLLRTNVGLARWDGETYRYGCPSRWGDDEGALAVASPDGARVLVAGRGGVYGVSGDLCGAVDLGLARDEVPLGLAWLDGAGWLLAGRFTDGEGHLGRWAGDGLETVARWSGETPDGLAEGDGALWLGGARDVPWRGRWTGDRVLREPWTDPPPVDRVAPRAVAGGVRFDLASLGSVRTVWRSEADAPSPVPEVVLGPAERIHGPVASSAGWIALLDGVLLRADAEGRAWSTVGGPTDWTCLHRVGEAVFACSLDALLRVVEVGPEGALDALPVASLTQLAGPSPACPDPDGRCMADWIHFGGESGFLTTEAATCPLGARRAPEVPPPEAACTGCGVDSRPGAPRAPLVWWLTAWAWNARRPRSRPSGRAAGA